MDNMDAANQFVLRNWDSIAKLPNYNSAVEVSSGLAIITTEARSLLSPKAFMHLMRGENAGRDMYWAFKYYFYYFES